MFRLPLPKIECSPAIISLSLAIFYVAAMNPALLSHGYKIVTSEEVSAAFVLSVPIFLIAALNLLFLPFAAFRAAKPVLILVTLLSAGVSFATFTYGVIFSKEMMINIAETDVAEASSFLNLPAMLWVLFLGVLPSLAIYHVEITPMEPRKKALHLASSAGISAVLIALIGAFFYQDYAVVLRNNSDLKRIIVPTYAVSSLYKFARDRYFVSPQEYKTIGVDARQPVGGKGGRKSLVIMVVGETARAMNYSLNGYERDTNRYTAKQGVDYFRDVTSCGTETAVSVPCMFSNLGRAGYDLEDADSQDNALDILKRAGVQMMWLGNNGGCKGVCKHIETIDIRKKYAGDKNLCGTAGCYDEAIVQELQDRIKTLKKENTVIVLHLMGSHGPSYFKRYPPSHASFKPDCQRSDIQNCDAQALVNTYDNTILYTDFVISGVIDILGQQEKNWDAALLYMSDHGESLGEKGIYLHGLPYRFAPAEQNHIPFISWMSPSYRKKTGMNQRCITAIASKGGLSHDNLFHTLLGTLGISTEAYKADMDVFKTCRAK